MFNIYIIYVKYNVNDAVFKVFQDNDILLYR